MQSDVGDKAETEKERVCLGKQVASQTTRRDMCETSVWELFGTDNTHIFMTDLVSLSGKILLEEKYCEKKKEFSQQFTPLPCIHSPSYFVQVRLVCRSLKQRMDEVMSSSFFQSYSLRRFKARAEILALKKISVMERMELLQKELSERHLKFDEDDPLLLRFKTGDWQSSSPLTLEHVISVRFMIEFLQNNGLQGTMLEFCCAQVMASMRRYLQKNLHATWMDAWHDVGVRSIGRLWWPRTTTSSMSATATSSSESSSNAGDRKQATASAAAPATTAAHGEEVWAQDYEFEEESWDGSDD